MLRSSPAITRLTGSTAGSNTREHLCTQVVTPELTAHILSGHRGQKGELKNRWGNPP